jgi:hypothetical protein
VKKSGASQYGEIRKRNGNALGNGNGVGGDALAMGLSLYVFKCKSASQHFQGVIVRLGEKIEGVGQLSGFLLHFIHQDSGKFSVFLFQFVHDWFTSQA